MTARLRHAPISTWAVRGLLFSLLWWAVAEGRPFSWPFAVPGIAGATLASVALWPSARWRPSALARFAVFFLVQSVRGGVDVAMRALLPWGQVRPGFEIRRLRVEHDQARLLLTNALTLVPGTLSARLDGAELLIHLLDTESGVRQSIDLLESHVAGLIAPHP